MPRKPAKKSAAPAPAIASEPRVLPSRSREETWPLDRIKPYERNAKEHPQEQIDQLRASFRRVGELQRIVVTEGGEIVAGHGRHQALLQENVAEARVLVAIDWTEEEVRSQRIFDNQVNLSTGYDQKLLKAELQDMASLGMDVECLGFSEAELAKLLNAPAAGQTDPDDAPEPVAVPTSRRGDVWLFGERHRLTCGDSTNPQDVARVLAGRKPHLMVTDPPYGVKYDPSWREEFRPSKDAALGKVLNDDRADWREAWALFPGDVAYVWHAGKFCGVVANSLEACRFEVRQQIIWVKQRLVIGRANYHFQHEPCLYAVREGADESWHFVPEHEVAAYAVRDGKPSHYDMDSPIARKQSTVWNIEHVKSETGHGTQKPVACMQRPIENNSQPGECIYEPFSGSGTTLIAAEITGRRCCAIELNQAYVDVGVKRWQAFTGLAATLEGDGRTFDEIAGVRAAEPADQAAA